MVDFLCCGAAAILEGSTTIGAYGWWYNKDVVVVAGGEMMG